MLKINTEEKLVQGLKLVVEAFAEMIANASNSKETTNSTENSMPDNHMMKVPEAAKYAGLSQNRIRTLMRQGKIEHVVVSNRLFLISKASIDKYFRKAQEESVIKD